MDTSSQSLIHCIAILHQFAVFDYKLIEKNIPPVIKIFETDHEDPILPDFAAELFDFFSLCCQQLELKNGLNADWEKALLIVMSKALEYLPGAYSKRDFSIEHYSPKVIRAAYYFMGRTVVLNPELTKTMIQNLSSINRKYVNMQKIFKK